MNVVTFSYVNQTVYQCLLAELSHSNLSYYRSTWHNFFWNCLLLLLFRPLLLPTTIRWYHLVDDKKVKQFLDSVFREIVSLWGYKRALAWATCHPSLINGLYDDFFIDSDLFTQWENIWLPACVLISYFTWSCTSLHLTQKRREFCTHPFVPLPNS